MFHSHMEFQRRANRKRFRTNTLVSLYEGIDDASSSKKACNNIDCNGTLEDCWEQSFINTSDSVDSPH